MTNFTECAVYSRLTPRRLRSNSQKQMCRHCRSLNYRKNIPPTARRPTAAEVAANIRTLMQTGILPRRTPTRSMAQTAAAPILLPFLPPQAIMPLLPDTRRGPVVYDLCLSLSLESYLFSSFFLLSLLLVMISLVIFSPVLRLCCLSRFSCAFLSYKYLLQGCVLFSNSVLTLFYQRVYRPKSLSLSVAHYAPSPHSFFYQSASFPLHFFFALMLILDGLFHSLSITLFSPALPLHSF